MNNQVYMTTLYCSQPDCLARMRIGRFLYLPATRVGAIAYCPICGGKAMAMKDTDEDYWEVLGNSYDLPAEVIKAVYAIWDRNEYQKFSDFVAVMKEESKKYLQEASA